MWSTVEQSIGVICACLPTLRPLFGKIFANNSHGSSTFKDNRYNTARTGPTIGLSRLVGNAGGSSGLATNSLEGGSTQGFARLEEEGLGEGSQGGGVVTTHVGRGSRKDVSVVPQAILKNQSIEQHYDHV